MELKDNWFSIPQTVYTSFEEKDSVLLYHTEKGCNACSKSHKIVKLIKDLYNPINMGVVSLNNYLPDDNTEKFIKHLLESDLCLTIPQSHNNSKTDMFSSYSKFTE